MAQQIEFVGIEDVLVNFRRLEIGTMKRAVEACEIVATEMENHSKNTRPWTDRTGNARRSIYGVAKHDDNNIIIYHGIGVDYGVYLELSNGGRFRVISTTVNSFRKIWLNRISRILG